ncbi:MAG: hypothetical protein U1F59_01225 [Candidatus Competibacteraceae bacterium]
MNEREDARPEGWFWREGQAVRWWTPQATGTLPLDPLAPAANGRAPTLADPPERCLLATTLAPALAQVLTERLDERPGPWRLHLGADLPEAWQRIPFESLLHRGQRLDARAQIVRRAAPLATPPVPPRTAEVVIVDLWPNAERIGADGRKLFAGLGESVELPRILRGYPMTCAQLPQLDLSDKALLCVIGHGGEGRAARPFRADAGESWTLPLSQGLPPLVLLLACGDEQGNLLDYGHALLQAGAQAVLAPVGRLDAPAADRFLQTFLAGWEAGRTVADLLWEAQQEPDSEYGARRLRLLGRGDLHRGPARAWAEQPDAALREAAKNDDAALRALLERITARGFRVRGHLDAAVDDLYDALGMQYDDRDAETAVLPRLDGLWERLPPLAAYWVAPYIVYLAEVYDHRLLPRYESLRINLKLDAPAAPPLPFIHHYWGKLHYRRGDYGRALAELAKGFALLDGTRLRQSSGVGLLGLLVNALIDFDLPGPGLALYDRLDACLDGVEDRLSLLQKTNRLDRRARLALRQGSPAKALIHYRQKQAMDRRDPDREWAGLLYAAAWADPLGQQARDLATAVGGRLRAENPVLDRIGQGNATLAYLLRAYALWTWRAANPAAFAWLVGQLTGVGDRLPARDSGPLGFALGYLHLYRRAAGEGTSVTLPPWEVAEGALEHDKYWFELAIFSALLARGDEARRFLGKFQEMRAGALPTLERLPDWLVVGPPIVWREELDRRGEEERRLLLADSPPAVEDLVAAGVVPL